MAEADGDHPVDRLAARPMILAHREHPLARGVDLQIGVAKAPAALGRERRGRRPRGEAIEALIGEIRRQHDALSSRVGAAPVLVHARAHVEGLGRQVRARAADRPAHQDRAPALIRPDLEPVGDLPIQARLGEPDLSRADQLRRDR